MHLTPTFYKLFGLLVAILVLAVVVLNIRVGKLNELSATVSLQRRAVFISAKVLPKTLSGEPVANGTVEQFLNTAFGPNALSGSAAKEAFEKTHGGKDPFPPGRQPKKFVPKALRKTSAPVNATVNLQ